MRRAITALLVTAAMTGSSGAFAQNWNDHHRNDGDQATQSDSGSGQRGNSHHDRGQGQGQGQGHGQGQGQGQIQQQTQIQGSGGGNGAHWNRGQGQGQGQGRGQVNGGLNLHNGGVVVEEHHQDNRGQWNGQRNRDNGHDNGQWRGNRQSGNWTSNWRSDRRYDWQALRNRDRNRFHLPSYRAPHGWGYRRYSRGYRLNPFFFANQYWFDAYQYGLPPAYGPYRWVRYFDDALLVNIETGEIEDVIPNFFW